MSPKYQPSPLGLMRREMGLPTHTIGIGYGVPENRLRTSILLENILVRKHLPSYILENIKELELRIQQLWHDSKSLSMSQLTDFSYNDIKELKKCFKRVRQFYVLPLGCRLSKDRIIEGITMRAREEFPDDPNYVEIQTRKLDEIFKEIQEVLTIQTNEILQEIDRVKKI